MNIKIFVTGGSFDKEYNELKDKLYFKDTHVPEMLTLGHASVPVDIETLMMLDSLDMKLKDRKRIAERCLEASEQHILITHGTDTMIETARVLAEKVHHKTIVLTGAMVPYKFGSSDGLFNLGSALAFVQTLPRGVYIVMQGRYFMWDHVRKDKETGEFVEVR